MIPYTPPKRKLSAFNCPLCGAYAKQTWEKAYNESGSKFPVPGSKDSIGDLYFAFCANCYRYTLWFEEKMIFPFVNGVPFPHTDLPKEVKEIYEEARSIFSRSPRAAAALLRLAIEILVNGILEEDHKRKDLNSKIGILVKDKHLPEKIKQALDLLRVIGNNAVHPGQIDMKDNLSIAETLFRYINFIADIVIRQPREIKQAFDSLPKEVLDAIDKRDSVEKEIG